MWWYACPESRYLTTLPHGRFTITRRPSTANRVFIYLTYTSRAFEWLPIRRIFTDCLTAIHREDIIPELDCICFGWRYLPPISSICYHPAFVFCQFSVKDLSSDCTTCACTNNRFRPFLDPLTLEEYHLDSTTAHAHVRTIDLRIINNCFLRSNLAFGLNHVIPQPSSFQEALHEILIAWDTFCEWSTSVDSDTTSKGLRILPDVGYTVQLTTFTTTNATSSAHCPRLAPLN